MKTAPASRVRSTLRAFGLHQTSQGNGTGHEVWTDARGRSCRPVLRKKDISMASLFSLGQELSTHGICTRREFLFAVKAGNEAACHPHEIKAANHDQKGDTTMEERSGQHQPNQSLLSLNGDQQWHIFERIYAGVKVVKELEDHEVELEIKLEELRSQMKKVRGETLQILK